MGAIVGGLYASGLSPDEIESALGSVDWSQVLNDRPDRTTLDFRRREEGRRYLFEVEMGFGQGRLLFPSGLIPGQELGLLFRRHTFHALGIKHFSELPIPFEAVATDVESGEPVFLDSGDLARVLRASMSVPVVFAPVEIDDRLLIDGGMRNNLPVDRALEMGADVVIAVDVSIPLADRERLSTLFDVYSQSLKMMARTGVDEQLRNADVVVTPELDDIGAADFPRVETIVDRGTAATRLVEDRLRTYALGPEAYAAYREKHRAKPPPPREARAVQLGHLRTVDPRLVDRRVTTGPGDRLDPSRLLADVRRVYGMGDFSEVDYSLSRQAGEDDLTIQALEKSWAPHYIHSGFELVTSSGGGDFRTGAATFTGIVNLTRTHFNRRGGEWRNDVRFGQTFGVFSEWFQPLDFGGVWFIAPRLVLEETEQPVFDRGELVAEYGIGRFLGGFDIGRSLGQAAEARIGLRWGRVESEVSTGNGDLPKLDDGYGGIRCRFVIDALENVNFPRGGGLGRVELLLSRSGLRADRSYERFVLDGGVYQGGDRHRVFLSSTVGSALGGELPAYDEFRLGGLLSLSGFGEGELRGSYLGVLRSGYAYRFARIPPASRGLYLAGWAEAGNTWARSEDIDLGDLKVAGTIAFGADTGLGPIFVAYGIADDGDDAFYLGIGRTFHHTGDVLLDFGNR
jgi:NTE family protein